MMNDEGDRMVSNERSEQPVTFDRHPSAYRHWRLEIEPPLARLTMAVDPEGGLNEGYQLKLNSYDLGVDIELNDAVQRLRFEHPEVRAVIVSGGLDKMFCAGANIQMLAGSTHHHKVNFCKFTNETRNSIEDATTASQQVWLAAVNGTAAGIELTKLERTVDAAGLRYPNVEVRLDRELGAAWFTLSGPSSGAPLASTPEAITAAGASFWPLAVARELDDAMLHLRFNEPEIGTWVLQSKGDPAVVLAADDVLREHAGHWLVREIRLYWRRTLKRLDLSARTLVTLVTPGSCFAGTLAELALAADRSFMLEGTFADAGDDLPPAELLLTDANDGWYAMSNGLTRLESRFWGHLDA